MLKRACFAKSLFVLRSNTQFGVCRTAHKMIATLYGDEASPPVRFVMMTASFLGVELKFHKIDLFSSENKTEFYTKINPLQKVPALEIGQEVICDSHAIALYLCRQSETQDLYPREDLAKSRVDQLMFFNSGSLFPVDSSIFSDYFAGKWPVDKSRIEHWYNLLDYLELQLNKNNMWLAGDNMTLSDLCCAATVSSLNLLIPVTQHHVNVSEWLKKLQTLPCFEINARGIQRLETFVVKLGSQ